MILEYNSLISFFCRGGFKQLIECIYIVTSNKVGTSLCVDSSRSASLSPSRRLRDGAYTTRLATCSKVIQFIQLQECEVTLFPIFKSIFLALSTQPCWYWNDVFVRILFHKLVVSHLNIVHEHRILLWHVYAFANSFFEYRCLRAIICYAFVIYVYIVRYLTI